MSLKPEMGTARWKLVCTGCGSTETINEIRRKHPQAISCCPERDMQPEPIWQPIETAPKDRMLLVGFFNSLGKWRSMHAQYRDDLPQHDDADSEDEHAPAGWYEGSLEAEILFPVNPTHWQFLPAAPEPPKL